MINEREIATEIVGKVLQSLTDRELGAMMLGFIYGGCANTANPNLDLHRLDKVMSLVISSFDSIQGSDKQLLNFAALVKDVRESVVEHMFENILKEVQNEG